MFNPVGPQFLSNPYRYYQRLRASNPVSGSPQGYWLLTRHEDVARVIRDPSFVTAGGYTETYGPRALEEPIFALLTKMMLLSDPPNHARRRRPVARWLNLRRSEELRPRIGEIADRLIDGVKARGAMDLIDDFAYPLSMTMLFDMIGIPEQDHLYCYEHFRANSKILGGIPLERAELDTANAQLLEMETYFRKLIEWRRRDPGQDLTSSLIHAQRSGEELSDEELVANMAIVFMAGHETTASLIGMGYLALHRNPVEMKRWSENSEIGRTAVNELLRYDNSVQHVSRRVEQDIEIGGRLLKKGELVFAAVGAANRDPTIYSDPDRLDLTRPNAHLLSFGGGMHRCVGAQLARLEIEIAIAALLRRLPDAQIEDPRNLTWKPTWNLRGLASLPVRWRT